MARHPHADIAIEWFQDTSRVVQFKAADHQPWEDCEGRPFWNFTCQYRFKPEPKPDVVTYFILINNPAVPSIKCAGSNLKAVFDGETGKLKSAEVLKNG